MVLFFIYLLLLITNIIYYIKMLKLYFEVIEWINKRNSKVYTVMKNTNYTMSIDSTLINIEM